MINHASRDHARWSASASDRRWACPGSLKLEEGLSDEESHAAAWGTAAHEVAELCLRNRNDGVDYLGRRIATKSHEIVVDDEVAECAQTFVDYVRDKWCEGPDRKLLIEQKFSLDAINPPIEGGGTGDAVVLSPSVGNVEIIDLKGGRGHVVEVTGNLQLRTYALGALLANTGPWQTVTATIVQPRAPHPDGRIRSETILVVDLLEWTHDLLDAMERAEDAIRHFRPEEHLNAGDHCRFCKAAPTCPALEKKSLEVAQSFFRPETGRLSTPPAPETLEMDQIVRILDHADMIQGWLNAVRGHAQRLAEAGVHVADGDSSYVLVPKQARRKWAEEDAVAAELAERTDRPAEDFFSQKLMSPAQVEKLIGKTKAKVILDGLVTKESSGFNLTRSDNTTREAIVPPAKQFFQPTKEASDG